MWCFTHKTGYYMWDSKTCIFKIMTSLWHLSMSVHINNLAWCSIMWVYGPPLLNDPFILDILGSKIDCDSPCGPSGTAVASSWHGAQAPSITQLCCPPAYVLCHVHISSREGKEGGTYNLDTFLIMSHWPELGCNIRLSCKGNWELCSAKLALRMKRGKIGVRLAVFSTVACRQLTGFYQWKYYTSLYVHFCIQMQVFL